MPIEETSLEKRARESGDTVKAGTEHFETNEEGRVPITRSEGSIFGVDPNKEIAVPRRSGMRKGDPKDPITPFTAKPVSENLHQTAVERNHQRSRQARTADASFNAPLAPSYRAWLQDPNRYDIIGVDTIPLRIAEARAQRALQQAIDQGLVEDFDVGAITGGDSTKGSFTKSKKRVKMQERDDLKDEYPMFQFGTVLAHETGHAIDRGAFVRLLENPEEAARVSGEPNEHIDPMETDYLSQVELEADDDLAADARTLTVRQRGAIREGDDAKDWDEYRASAEEMMGDALASAIIEPRAARREAPALADHLDRNYLDLLDQAAEEGA